MNTDPQQILADVDAVLADLPGQPTDDPPGDSSGDFSEESSGEFGIDDIDAIEALGRRLEHAHQILVDALESVEKG